VPDDRLTCQYSLSRRCYTGRWRSEASYAMAVTSSIDNVVSGNSSREAGHCNRLDWCWSVEVR